MHVGVDFDDVLYPYHDFLKRRIAKRWGVDLSGARITTYFYELHPLLAAKGVTREALWNEVQAAWSVAEDHAQAALLDPDAADVLTRLGKKHRITLVTARKQEALELLKGFLARHDIHPHEILLGKEDKRGFDILIDDFPRHAEQNAESGGTSLLYHRDENSNYDESRHPRIIRVHSWREIESLIPHLETRSPSRA